MAKVEAAIRRACAGNPVSVQAAVTFGAKAACAATTSAVTAREREWSGEGGVVLCPSASNYAARDKIFLTPNAPSASAFFALPPPALASFAIKYSQVGTSRRAHERPASLSPPAFCRKQRRERKMSFPSADKPAGSVDFPNF